jgi:hypothetical protein
MRRYRRRRFYGKLIVPLEINEADVNALIYGKLLDPRHKGDRVEVGKAVLRALWYR